MTTHRAWAIQVGTDDGGFPVWHGTHVPRARRLIRAELQDELDEAEHMAGQVDGHTVPLLIHRADEDIVTRDVAASAYWEMSAMENHTPEGQIEILHKALNAKIREGGK